MRARVLWKNGQYNDMVVHIVDALYSRPHELGQPFEGPNDIMDLANALFRVLSTRAKIDCRAIVYVISPYHHLASHRLHKTVSKPRSQDRFS